MHTRYLACIVGFAEEKCAIRLHLVIRINTVANEVGSNQQCVEKTKNFKIIVTPAKAGVQKLLNLLVYCTGSRPSGVTVFIRHIFLRSFHFYE